MTRDEHRAPSRLVTRHNRRPTPPPRQQFMPEQADYSMPDDAPELEQGPGEQPALVSDVPRYHSPAERTVDPSLAPGELSKQERHQLLMTTIRLYEQAWKLASIRSNPHNHALAAYLIPRRKRISLKAAISRNQVLIITIDSRGNTNVREPEQRGLFRSLTSWILGD